MDRPNAQRVKDFANTQHLADPLLPACPNAKVAATDPMSHRDDAVDDRQAKSLTSSSPASPLQAMIWLRSMALFCEELSIFVQTEVPEDADPSEYTKVPADAIGREEAYAHMLAACGWRNPKGALHTSGTAAMNNNPARYMMDIPCHVPECKSAVELVQGLGAETYALINRHPAFGKFRCSEGKGMDIHANREKLFFEDPLNICMALGTEHGWLDLAECRKKARQYLASKTQFAKYVKQ